MPSFPKPENTQNIVPNMLNIRSIFHTSSAWPLKQKLMYRENHYILCSYKVSDCDSRVDIYFIFHIPQAELVPYGNQPLGG